MKQNTHLRPTSGWQEAFNTCPVGWAGCGVRGSRLGGGTQLREPNDLGHVARLGTGSAFSLGQRAVSPDKELFW